MSTERQQHEFTLWRSGEWRCEFWIVGGTGLLRVYRGRRLEREQAVIDAAASFASATAWRSAVDQGEGLPPD